MNLGHDAHSAGAAGMGAPAKPRHTGLSKLHADFESRGVPRFND